ncbi:serine hydrolase [Rhodococcus sp. IEGM 1305]|nr:serine hydrolase [Rhodococcus sp. IEGM 1305]MDI9951641.1 hypothetical protein [Rhodococcus sp. IEGM 1305]
MNSTRPSRYRCPSGKRWYLPNTDGGAHPKALQRLGVTEPDDTVTLEQMVTAMIQESDNAVPDYLRDRLGDAAAQAGWDDLEVPTLNGSPPRPGWTGWVSRAATFPVWSPRR